jgi:hypothetical protein
VFKSLKGTLLQLLENQQPFSFFSQGSTSEKLLERTKIGHVFEILKGPLF